MEVNKNYFWRLNANREAARTGIYGDRSIVEDRQTQISSVSPGWTYQDNVLSCPCISKDDDGAVCNIIAI